MVQVIVVLIGSLSVLLGQYFQYRWGNKKDKEANVKLDNITQLSNGTLTMANQRIRHLEDQIDILIDQLSAERKISAAILEATVPKD